MGTLGSRCSEMSNEGRVRQAAMFFFSCSVAIAWSAVVGRRASDPTCIVTACYQPDCVILGFNVLGEFVCSRLALLNRHKVNAVFIRLGLRKKYGAVSETIG